MVGFAIALPTLHYYITRQNNLDNILGLFTDKSIIYSTKIEFSIYWLVSFNLSHESESFHKRPHHAWVFHHGTIIANLEF